MKKTLCSLVCLGALSLNADVLVGVDFLGASYKEPDGVKYDDKTIFTFNLNLTDYKINDDSGLTGLLRLGYSAFETDYKTTSIITTNGKTKANNFYYDLMLGYGFNLSQDDIKHALNILVGFNHQSYENETEAENFAVKVSSKTIVKTNALKAGVSYYAIAPNNIFVNAELFVKNYLDDKRNAFVSKDDEKSKTAVEGDIAVGYKFNGANSGAYVGLKVGYIDDLMGKGGHYGLTAGYIF